MWPPCDRFYELTGHYPDHITVVSYTLKQNRFSTLHRGALRFPIERFKFVGTPVSIHNKERAKQFRGTYHAQMGTGTNSQCCTCLLS